MTGGRAEANQLAWRRLVEADPVLLDVQRAVDAVPGMAPNMILTAGAPLPWRDYAGAQRTAIQYAAVHEKLARTAAEADEKIRAGEILVGSTHDHGCVGPHTGIHTASMPVFVVEGPGGARGFCTFFEGDATPRRLSLGFYDDEVAAQLAFVADVLAPTIGEAIRRRGGVRLSPIFREALLMGDDGHVRTAAGTLLFTRALLPALLDLAGERGGDVRRTLAFLETASYSFLRPWLAADKSLVESIAGVEGSSLVTVMSLNCKEFAIQVSGLGHEWFRGPHPRFEGRIGETVFDGTGALPIPEGWGWFGADSLLAECLGFGGFAGAAAFPLQAYYLRGGTTRDMVERNLAMYDITVGEHPDYRIPFLDHRGLPIGIDLFKVLETGRTPAINGSIARMDGTGFTGGVVWPPMECFEAAAAAYRARYGS
ncbi:MAG TPA: DUF1116 domain-containing protein [Kofleriaceae bacterium]|nr:DUF1116 domain-containing protein [Kofleriaceae bacterium]